MFAISKPGDWTHEPRQACMVWDCFYERPERFYRGAVVGPLENARAYVEERAGCAGRLVILKFEALWPVRAAREDAQVSEEIEEEEEGWIYLPPEKAAELQRQKTATMREQLDRLGNLNSAANRGIRRRLIGNQE